MDPLFDEGIALLNRGEYFAAHDALEEVWRPVRGDQRLFFQGIVQVAIAMHHFSRQNLPGAQSVLQRCRRNLAPYPQGTANLDLDDLRQQLERWQSAMAAGGPWPPPVNVRRLRSGC